MGKIDIYYFTGTGNSLAVARDIAEKTKGNLIPITSQLNKRIIKTEADIIGLVFPIYDFKPPEILINFIDKLKNVDSKYFFAVCTYGITPAKSLKYLDEILSSYGGNLSGGFAVQMPHNGIGSGAINKSRHKKMYDDWNNKLEEICKYVKYNKKGTIETSILFLNLFQFRFLKMIPYLIKFLFLLLLKGIDSLEFTSSQQCNECGICEKVCPVNNINIESGKPVWSDHCEGCFACLHWCPKEAISIGGYKMNIKSYHHPDVKIIDIINND